MSRVVPFLLCFIAVVLSGSFAAEDHPFSLKNAVETARRHQFNFRDREGARVLEEALAQTRGEVLSPGDAEFLVEAHLLAASCFQNVGNREETNRYLSEAARLNPALEPSELNYPPSLIAAFEKVRRSIFEREKFSQIFIDSRPSGARIFVNGVYKGKSPLRLEQFSAGSHLLYATRDDSGATKKVSLSSGESLNVTLRLKKKKVDSL